MLDITSPVPIDLIAGSLPADHILSRSPREGRGALPSVCSLAGAAPWWRHLPIASRSRGEKATGLICKLKTPQVMPQRLTTLNKHHYHTSPRLYFLYAVRTEELDAELELPAKEVNHSIRIY